MAAARRRNGAQRVAGIENPADSLGGPQEKGHLVQG